MSDFASLARTTPHLDSSLIAVHPSPGAGYGVIASTIVQPSTTLLISPKPAAHVVFRAFRREVCAHCFAYDRGRSWKIKDQLCGMVFCTVACYEAWNTAHTKLAREAYAALEAFMQTRGRKDYGKPRADRIAFDDKIRPTEDEIIEAWQSVEDRATLIRNTRSLDDKKSTKAQRKALQAAIQLSLDDTDIICFLLSGIITHATSPSLWDTFLSVSAQPCPYDDMADLLATTYAYLQLLAILPVDLLPSTTPAIIHALIARDSCNSFGIWSGGGDRDGDEFLGYGIWPSGSFFNHSCAPSVLISREGNRWLYKSTPNRMVGKGEDLCISYLGSKERIWSREERMSKLRKGWNFDCLCQKCVSEGTAVMSD